MAPQQLTDSVERGGQGAWDSGRLGALPHYVRVRSRRTECCLSALPAALGGGGLRSYSAAFDLAAFFAALAAALAAATASILAMIGFTSLTGATSALTALIGVPAVAE